MTIDDVRRLLRGWREVLPSAVLSPDKIHLFYTIDFTPPASAGQRPLRTTFDNGRLFIWGEPADISAQAGEDPAVAG